MTDKGPLSIITEGGPKTILPHKKIFFVAENGGAMFFVIIKRVDQNLSRLEYFVWVSHKIPPPFLLINNKQSQSLKE